MKYIFVIKKKIQVPPKIGQINIHHISKVTS